MSLRSLLLKVLPLLAWGALLAGVLSISTSTHAVEHSVCGPWGCGPPTAVLIGWHSFWLCLFLPPALFAGLQIPPRIVIWTGFAMLGCAVTYLGIALGSEYYEWSSGDELQQQYAIQRTGFVWITNQLPVTQFGLAGLTAAVTGLFRPRRDETHPL